MTFTRNEVRGTHLDFSKEEISRFHIESGRFLGRKVFSFFSTPLGQPQEGDQSLSIEINSTIVVLHVVIVNVYLIYDFYFTPGKG